MADGIVLFFEVLNNYCSDKAKEMKLFDFDLQIVCCKAENLIAITDVPAQNN
jgi:hypothetical protein